MAEIRIRCQVLKTIAAMDSGTAEDVAKHLPNLKPSQVQKALHHLCDDDEVRKIGKVSRDGLGGRAFNLYQIRDEETQKDTSRKKVYKKTGRKDYGQSLKRPAHRDPDRHLIVVLFREKKIRLLTKLLNLTHGTDKDLLIGCINDYKA